MLYHPNWNIGQLHYFSRSGYPSTGKLPSAVRTDIDAVIYDLRRSLSMSREALLALLTLPLPFIIDRSIERVLL
ncbi:MAG: hypothetical protein ABFD46_04195 [Armatimonadota bacterium]